MKRIIFILAVFLAVTFLALQAQSVVFISGTSSGGGGGGDTCQSDPGAYFSNARFLDGTGLYCTQFTAPGSGTIDIVDARAFGMFSNAGGNYDVRFAFYDDNSNVPDNYITNSATAAQEWTSGAEDTNVWVTATYGTKPTLTAGNTYWQCVWSHSGGAGDFELSMAINTSGGTGYYLNDQTYNATNDPLDPWSGGSSDNDETSMCFTWE